MIVRPIVIGRIDIVPRGSADRARKLVQDRLGGGIGGPVAVPDVIDVGLAQHHRSAVVEDSVVREPGELRRVLLRFSGRVELAPSLAVRLEVLILPVTNLGGLDGSGQRENACRKNHGRVQSALLECHAPLPVPAIAKEMRFGGYAAVAPMSGLTKS